ncbi:BTAD domain-containing putative transcriptional regulator [Actinoallomurus sp. CA-150999]|uniref:BTAD domain-containing putative transcriptional regulator n=1 Tax=Actinoallomurus sp. CA-150999 TaxID=3239887 RepID=UPI003D8B1DE7
MRFGMLGPLSVWTDDGRPVPVPGLKVRALLADLLVHAGRPVPADRLIDDLWGDRLPGNPSGALSAKVSQLRRVLEDAEPGTRTLVVSRPAGYLLQVDDDRLDAHRFRSLIRRAREAAEPTATAAALADALALWRGPALADFADEPFAQATVARLTEQWLTALEDHAEVRLAVGEHGALVGELGDLLSAHPLRERLRAAHMRALYRSGRQSEALDSYDRLRTELADELGLDPGPELVALHQAILEHDPALEAPQAPGVPARPRTNLHAPTTELIGRDDALAAVADRLATDRLVTLTGPGGVGKTRLAVEAAARLADGFPDGAWLVELAGLSGSSASAAAPVDAPADAVMRVLDIRDAAGEGGPVAPVDRLADALSVQRLLLVLDNCEHLIEPVAELADRLLRATPGLRVLATSREPLGLTGEVVWSVPPLEIPARADEVDPAALARSSAVRLFVDRATAAARGFRLDVETAPAVAVLCRRLDGIPLALELAATRMRALGVHGLVARLDDRFRLLATGHRGAPQRQRTLMAMIDWSWELLSEPERTVLRRLSVQADGCALEAAEAVCSGAGLPAEEVLDLLVRLVDRSLVVMTEHGDDGPRYRLLESVAAYCADRLEEAGEHEPVRRRHRRYYTALAERAEPHLYGHDQARWLSVLDTEAANLRTALDDAVANGDAESALRLVNAQAWSWFLRGRLAEARRSLEAALALRDGPARISEQARALSGAPTQARALSDDPAPSEHAHTLSGTPPDAPTQARTLSDDPAPSEHARTLSGTPPNTPTQARTLSDDPAPYEHVRALGGGPELAPEQAVGDAPPYAPGQAVGCAMPYAPGQVVGDGPALVPEQARCRAMALVWRAGMALLQGDRTDWAVRRQEALRLFEDADAPAALARARWFLAFTAGEVEDLAAGAALLDQALEGFDATGDRWGRAAVLILRAKYAHAHGDPALLESEVERAARLFAEVGDRWGQLQAAEWLGALAELTGDHERADRLQRRGLAAAEELRLWPDVAMRLAWLGWSAMMRRAYPSAREYGERALRLAVEQGNQPAVVFARITVGLTALREGDLDVAEEHLETLLRAVPRDTEAVPPPHLPLLQMGLGYVAERRGDAATALAFHRDALVAALRMEAPRDTAGALEAVAGALGLAGHPTPAARLLGAAAAVRRSSGLAAGPVERDDIDRATARIRAALPEAAFAAAYDEGGSASPTDCLEVVAMDGFTGFKTATAEQPSTM